MNIIAGFSAEKDIADAVSDLKAQFKHNDKK